MAHRVSLSVSLTAELAALVTEKVRSGRYGSASEVVRSGLRLLEAAEATSGLARPVEEASHDC